MAETRMAYAETIYILPDKTQVPVGGEVEVAYETEDEKALAESQVARGVLSWHRRTANVKKPAAKGRGRS